MQNQVVTEYVHEETYMFIALLILAGWILWLLFRRYQMNAQARLQRTEAFNRLIEKFATASEFVQFLNSEPGKKFFEPSAQQQTHPAKITLRFVQAGVILAALSIAIGFQWHMMWDYVQSHPNPDMNWVNKEMDLHYWMAFTIALAAGMFVVAWVTHLFSKKWQPK
jgi:NADH:ubiquinone oxidoreductase subunit 5 (subunit L)/multisubunit Na+/H+ antiporter MnhA subunit